VIRPATKVDRARVSVALQFLANALEFLKDAHCPKAAEKVRRAIKSAEGAERHISTRMRATEDSLDIPIPVIDHLLTHGLEPGCPRSHDAAVTRLIKHEDDGCAVCATLLDGYLASLPSSKV
jgi:hypothetical protein